MSNVAVATIYVSLNGVEKNQISIREGQSVRFGRLDTSDYQLNDPSISRAHASLTASSSGVVISDLSSTNGTFVNGKRIEIPVDLQKGDVIDLGPFKITLELHSAEIDKHLVSAGRTMTAQLKPSTSAVVVLKLRLTTSDIPETDLQEQKRDWQQTVSRTIESTDGKIDKVLEDSIIAIWFGMDAEKVCGEALNTAERLVTLTRQLSLGNRWEKYHQFCPWDCVAGISSGLALTGSVGGKDGIRNFAVLGDTINSALNVAQAGKETQARVLVNDQVVQNIKSISFNEVLKINSAKPGHSLVIYAPQ